MLYNLNSLALIGEANIKNADYNSNELFDHHMDIKRVLVNIVHNYQFVQENYRELVRFFTSTSRDQYENRPYSAGFSLGLIIYYTIVDVSRDHMFDAAADPLEEEELAGS